MLEGLGAHVTLVPQVDGTPGHVTGADIAAAAETALKLADEHQGFYVNQFQAEEGFAIHCLSTGPEIWQQTGGKIDAWVAAVGTGATFLGVAMALKKRNPNILCAAVEPEGAEPLAGKPVSKPRHLLQGIGYGKVPPHWDSLMMDLSIAVSDVEAETWRLDLARREGLYVGYSAAANVCGAEHLLRSGRLGADSVVVTVLCDTGLKY
jgi:cysteine synthase A